MKLSKDIKKNLKEGRGVLVIALVLMLVAVPFIGACTDEEATKETVSSPPAEQKFSLAIADNSLKDKNGAPILTLKFGEGTPSANIVVAERGTPTIDGRDGDIAWGPASEVVLIPVNAGVGPTTATVKAAYDDNNIYFLVKWEDPTQTESIHKDMWTYNAADGTWTQAQSEDRVYFLFNISASDFDEGCSVYCHLGDPAWDFSDTKMGTNTLGERIDVWHWKAGRTNPTGYAEDKLWLSLAGAAYIPYGEVALVAMTRVPDRGDGFASVNREAGLPKYMHRNGPGTNADFLFETDAVAFDPNANWSDGDTIPGYILTEGTGSRADVVAVGTYSDETWVVEFKRSLITNDPDDIQFE